MRPQLRLDDVQLVLLVRVAERRPHEEAVELGLRQRECPLLLDRVLGREHEEGIGEGPRDAVDRHLRSAIASSSADCVFGIARLISSTSTTFAKIGPARNSKSRCLWS